MLSPHDQIELFAQRIVLGVSSCHWREVSTKNGYASVVNGFECMFVQTFVNVVATCSLMSLGVGKVVGFAL